MNDEGGFVDFFWSQRDKLLEQVGEHAGITLLSLLFAILIGIPAGILIVDRKRAASFVLGVAGILQTIPGIALLGFFIPFLGIGLLPAIVALFLYALLPIIRNTYVGITGINPVEKEAAVAMGMNKQQVLFRVQLPLAMPVIIAGVRTAAVINIGVATLAAYIGAGGLGEFIFGGIAMNNTNMILCGALPAALLAIVADQLLSLLQKTSKKGKRKLIPGSLIIAFCVGLGYGFSETNDNGMVAGFTPEFIGRKDGYLGLKDVYKFKMNSVVISDAVMYRAAYEGKLDVISGYSTDGRLKAFDLKVLEDDRHIFPPYQAALVVRNNITRKYPELITTLNLLSGRINDSVMTELNYHVDYLHESPEKVAGDFLKSSGLLMPPRTGTKGKIRIGSKIFTEQYILTEIYKLLIKGYTELDVETITGLGGTSICFDALINDRIDMYPEYSGTAFLVILKAPENISNKIFTDREAVFNYVKDEFNKQYQLTYLSPIGFNNAYALMMKRKHAEEMGINSISELIDNTSK